ncbi:hypothetical protein [Cellulomonas shaoxiangyii]|nr:hypothetical protein [Cellulomonas shaoxiangyii]
MAEVHVTPVADLIEHEEHGDGCPCGPDAIFEPGGVVMVHHSLDGREARE